MKRSFRFRLLNLLFLCGLCVNTSFAEKLSEGDGVQPKQVLIVGLKDNVRSNYFYKGMIAEETGMQADSVDFIYNQIIAENIPKVRPINLSWRMRTLFRLIFLRR